MVKGVDDLIYFLLERISLRSGATYVEIEQYVREFYAQPEGNGSDSHTEQNGLNLISGTSNSPGPAKVDARLLDKVWQWLLDHPDVHVENVAENQQLETQTQATHVIEENIQTKTRFPRTVAHGLDTGNLPQKETSNDDLLLREESPRLPDTIGGRVSANLEPGDTFRLETQHQGLVLRTTPQRVWQAIAGHEVDYSRIPKSEFELLSLIAAAGEQGIAQTTLIRQSKQDKKSLPKRTDELHRKGYIYKTAIRRPGEHTSQCVLRKLAGHTPVPKVSESWSQMTPAELKSTIFQDGAYQKENFIAAAMEIIKQAGIITVDNFRIRMDIKGDRSGRQTADLWLYQMELIGCIQRILVDPMTARQKHGPKTLRYVKDADQTALDAYMKFHRKDRQNLWQEKRPSHEQLEERTFPPDSVEYASADLDEGIISHTPLVRWHPQQALENQVYDVIHESGSKGISSINIVDALAGSTPYRAMNSLLSRLTDVWQESQPHHLRHLAIIRDTALRNGCLIYNYRTFPNFDLAVKAGEASWEAVMESYEKTNTVRDYQDQSSETLNEWGFPTIAESEFTTKSLTLNSRESDPKSRVAAPQKQGRERAFSDERVNKRRKIKDTSRSRQEPPQDTPAQRTEVDQSAKKVFKVQIDFEEQMRRRASDLVAQQTFGSEDDNSGSKNESSGQPLNNTDIQHLSRSHEQTLLEMQRNLVNMILPGLYINPPQRIQRIRGRPPKRILIVIKSNGLQDIDWFRKSSEFERYHHYPSTTYSPPMTPERSEFSPARLSVAEDVEVEAPRAPSLEVLATDSAFKDCVASNRTHEGALNTSIPLSTQQDPHTSVPYNHTGIQLRPRGRSKYVESVAGDFASDIVRFADKATDSSLVVDAQSEIQSHDSHDRHKSGAYNKYSKKGVRLSGGTQERHRSDLLMQILTQAGGLYPGPKELWYPFVTVLQKADSTARPDPGTVERAVINLVKSGRLIKLQFAFKASGGLHISRSIIALPGFDGNSEPVRKLEKNMIEQYPEIYLPDSFEVDPLLKTWHSNRRIPEANASTRISGYVPAPGVELQPSGSVRRKKDKITTPPPLELESDDDEEEEICDVQRSLQSSFAIDGYIHRPAAVPQSRNKVGHKLGKIIHLSGSSGKPSEDLPTASKQAMNNIDPLLLESIAPPMEPRNILPTQPAARQEAARMKSVSDPQIHRFQFISVPETAAAAQHELLREQEAFRDVVAGASEEMNDAFVKVNPQAWIIVSSKVQNSGYAAAVTLTDPDQEFHALSGTFSTCFAVIRNTRPKLKLLANLQRNFEDQIPHSLADIIENRSIRGRPTKKSKRASHFNDIIDEVEAWEQENSQMLESSKSLMIPRFINHAVAEHEDLIDTVKTRMGSAVLKTTEAERERQSRRETMQFEQEAQQISSGLMENREISSTAHPNNMEISGSNQSAVLLDSNSRLESEVTRAKVLKRPGRKPVRESKLSEDQVKQLIAIVVAVRCLLGGTDRVIKWPIVLGLFPGFSRITALKYRWNLILPAYGGYIEEFERSFQKKFVQAYEKGDVDMPDYHNIDSYNWQTIVDWALEHIRTDLHDEAPGGTHVFGDGSNEQDVDVDGPDEPMKLLTDRQKFDEQYSLQIEADYFEKSINDLLNSANPITRRTFIMGELPFVLPLDNSEHANAGNDPKRSDVVKSIVRANIIAPSLNYDPDRARARLVPFGEAALNAAIKDLQKAKIIKQENKGRAVPGRNFSMSKTFFDGFRSHWKMEIFAAAVDFKHLLDEKFSIDGYFEFSPHASQGEVLAMLNLKLLGRIDVQFVEPSVITDPSKSTLDAKSGERVISIWGFTEGDYKTTHVNTRNFVFPVHITPTLSWTEDIPLPESVLPPPAPHLIGWSADGNMNIEPRIPLWYDIHDRVIQEVWELVIAAVINTIALAPGVGAKEIVNVCKKMIEEWEVVHVLKWMEEMRMVKRTMDGVDRFKPTDWWWYILGTTVSGRS